MELAGAKRPVPVRLFSGVAGASGILRAMSAVEGLPAPLPSVEPLDRPGTTSDLPDLCPYLATSDGGWRSATPIRDHRCMAVAPPVPLAPEKQRRLCLVAAHAGCATFGAAEATREASGPAAFTSRPIARMTPVILDHGRFDLRLPTLRADRATGQALLVGVLGVALTAILIARPSGNAGAAAGPESTASASGSVAVDETPGTSPGLPSAAPTEIAPTTEPAATPPPSTAASVPPASPAASSEPATSGETYRVKSGDTLSAIAARFNTTVRVLADLNGITDPSRLRVGQVLKLP